MAVSDLVICAVGKPAPGVNNPGAPVGEPGKGVIRPSVWVAVLNKLVGEGSGVLVDVGSGGGGVSLGWLAAAIVNWAETVSAAWV